MEIPHQSARHNHQTGADVLGNQLGVGRVFQGLGSSLPCPLVLLRLSGVSLATADRAARLCNHKAAERPAERQNYSSREDLHGFMRSKDWMFFLPGTRTL